MTKKQSTCYYRLIMIVIGLFISQSAAALSLGEIVVRSHFAEPFLAEISLPSYSADEMESINIHVASRKQHEAMGYEYSEATKHFRFSVKENDKGALYIEVRSEKPVKELSISLLMEVTTINGRIIKGYDILLTPKAISGIQDTRSPVISRNLKAAKFSVKQTTQSSPSEQQTKTSKVKKLSGGGLEYTSVGYGESLSRIAQRMRPRKSMHMHQVMLALYEQNPDAFVNGNINNLKAGVKLTLKDIDSIENVSKLEASQLVVKYGNPQHKESENLLQISSTEEGLPPDVLEAIRQEQVASAQAELDKAREMIRSMEMENNELLERIAKLEAELDKAAESLFLAQTKHDEEKERNQNTLVMNAKIENNNQENESILTQYQTTFSVAAAGFLAIVLVGVRKKENILEAIENFKSSRNKSRDNIFN